MHQIYVVVRNPIYVPDIATCSEIRAAEITTYDNFDDAVNTFILYHQWTEIYHISADINGSTVRKISEGEIWKRVCQLKKVI